MLNVMHPLAVMHQQRIINIYSIYLVWLLFGFI